MFSNAALSKALGECFSGGITKHYTSRSAPPPRGEDSYEKKKKWKHCIHHAIGITINVLRINVVTSAKHSLPLRYATHGGSAIRIYHAFDAIDGLDSTIAGLPDVLYISSRGQWGHHYATTGLDDYTVHGLNYDYAITGRLSGRAQRLIAGWLHEDKVT